jgi:hypothetical protein
VEQRLAARKGNASAVRIEDAVFKQFCGSLINSDALSEQFQHSRRTCHDTTAASLTVWTVELMLTIDNAVAGADFRAFSTKCAFGIVNRKLWLRLTAFWIVAPDATQRTAFQEQRRPYARAVMDGEAFYVDVSCLVHVKLLKQCPPLVG